MRKHLSTFANNLLAGCARSLGTSVDDLVGEFELGLEPEVTSYSRKLVEFCSSRFLVNLCQEIKEKISDGSFSQITFDMMIAWECPTVEDEEHRQPEIASEIRAKEKEDSMDALKGKESQPDDDVSLFYSDLVPLLVDEERSVGKDAFVWLASLLPLVADVANGHFTFEAITSYTSSRLHFPAYDMFLKEIYKCIEDLQKQVIPTGIELAVDEFILHVEGTTTTPRVVRHIGATSWPGRLTLTNRALYFEASGIISYEDALKIDLSSHDVNHQVKATSTGPWGAPLFDKAMAYESSQLADPVVLEFPEITGSTRRDHWLALTKEVILLHQFLTKFNIISTLKEWEMQSRTILGIIRLHAARKMMRISPPIPMSFLIFTLYNELPKGDYVLEELSSTLKQANEMQPCSASSILRAFDMSHPTAPCNEAKEGLELQPSSQTESLESLERTIDQVREEAKEVSEAKSTVQGIKEEGISYNLLLLLELLSPLKGVGSLIKGVLTWERPLLTSSILVLIVAVIYKEWVGYLLASLLLCGVGTIWWTRHQRQRDKPSEILVSTASDQTTMEVLVSAQHSMRNVREKVQTITIFVLKIQSILLARAPKHTDMVMLLLLGVAAFLVVVPFRYILIALTLYCFTSNWKSEPPKLIEHGDRRLREWWDSIPVAPVRIVDEPL